MNFKAANLICLTNVRLGYSKPDDLPTNQLAVSQLADYSQLAEMFDVKFGIGLHNSFKCYLGQITLFIHCQYSIGLELRLGLGLMYELTIVCVRVDLSAT